jgi:hypothetical protein
MPERLNDEDLERTLDEALRAAIQHPAPTGLRAKVLARIVDAERPRALSLRRWAAAGAGLAAVAAVAWLSLRREPPSIAPARPSSAQFSPRPAPTRETPPGTAEHAPAPRGRLREVRKDRPALDPVRWARFERGRVGGDQSPIPLFSIETVPLDVSRLEIAPLQVVSLAENGS